MFVVITCFRTTKEHVRICVGHVLRKCVVNVTRLHAIYPRDFKHSLPHSNTFLHLFVYYFKMSVKRSSI